MAARLGAEAETAAGLIDALLARRSYDAELVAAASALARDPDRSWELRCLAILALEHQCHRAVENRVGLLEPLAAIGVIERGAGGYLVGEAELAAGYSSTEPAAFAREFAHKLERAARVHRRLCGPDLTSEDLDAFLDRAGQECRLLLGRYLLPPGDVVARVRSLLRVSARRAGASDSIAGPEADAELARLPAYEAEICRRLLAAEATYWVDERTPSRRFALVEYPLGTVVCVIKPPGSELEIEIKRAGLRGPHPITVRWQHDGRPVPVPHRLQGASMAESLRAETARAALLAGMFHLVHGTQAPISRPLGLARIATVPRAAGDEPLARFLGSETVFGHGFADMRRELRSCLAAFSHEDAGTLPGTQGPEEEAARFLDRVAPSQAVLVNTSSLRLDTLSAGLSGGGPERYLEDLGLRGDATQARRVADDLLEEVLDRYHPPELAYRDCETYVAGALARPEFRRRADRCFLSLATQIGEFWGTLLAFRGATRGESFVARNAGLRRVWRNGEWRVEIRFMDHDGLDLAAGKRREPQPRRTLRAMAEDAWYIFGPAEEGGELGQLARIYRVQPAVVDRGSRRLRAAARKAYRAAIRAVLTRPELRKRIRPDLLESWLDLDEVVGLYRRTGPAGWQEPVERHLVAKGRLFRIAADYVLGIEDQTLFLDQHGDVFLNASEIADLARGHG